MNYYEAIIEATRRVEPEAVDETITLFASNPQALANLKSMQIEPGAEEALIQELCSQAKALKANPLQLKALQAINRLTTAQEKARLN